MKASPGTPTPSSVSSNENETQSLRAQKYYSSKDLSAALGEHMQEVELTLGRLAKIYWLLLWHGAIMGVLGGLILGAIAGGIGGFIVGFQGHPEQARSVGATAGAVAGGLLWIPLGFLLIRMALQKKYKDFRILIVAPPNHGLAES